MTWVLTLTKAVNENIFHYYFREYKNQNPLKLPQISLSHSISSKSILALNVVIAQHFFL